MSKKLNVGDRFQGTVVSVKDFGVFIQMPNRLDGLLKNEDMLQARSGNQPSNRDCLKLVVLSIEPSNGQGKDRYALGEVE